MTRFWWALGAVIVLAALYVCLAPVRDVPRTFELNDKISHAVGHALMAIYFAGLVPRARWWKVALGLTLFGVGVEVAQHFMQVGRQADVRDLIANATGLGVGLLLSYVGLSRWPRWLEALLGRRSAT